MARSSRQPGECPLSRRAETSVKELTEMRKFFYGTAILLLAAGMAFAQSSTTPDQSTTPSQSASQSSSSNTIQGCLSGSDNNFTLTDQSGKTYVLKAEGQDLKAHVGHTVSVQGRPMSASESGAASSTGAASTSASSGQESFHVDSVQMISDKCQSGGGATPSASSTSP